MQTLGLALPGMLGGGFMTLLGVLCFVFNRGVGRLIRGFPLLAFGVRQSEPVDEIIFRGLACVLGLLYTGFGLALLTSSLV
jgi:hypothetical protein